MTPRRAALSLLAAVLLAPSGVRAEPRWGVLGGARYFRPSYLNLRRGDWTSGLESLPMEDFVPSMGGFYGGLAFFANADNSFQALGAFYERRVNVVYDTQVVASIPQTTIAHRITRATAWSVELDWRRYRSGTTRFRPYGGLGLTYGEVKTDLEGVGAKFIGLPAYVVGLLLRPRPWLSLDLNLKTDTRFVVPMNGTASASLSLWL